MIEEGKTYNDPLNTKLTVQKVENGRVYYLTNYDDIIRDASVKDFSKWTIR